MVNLLTFVFFDGLTLMLSGYSSGFFHIFRRSLLFILLLGGRNDDPCTSDFIFVSIWTQSTFCKYIFVQPGIKFLMCFLIFAFVRVGDTMVDSVFVFLCFVFVFVFVLPFVFVFAFVIVMFVIIVLCFIHVV